jgi:hypothetical protein
MLFDVRGKRKRVIQVIYVLLAAVMVLSLFVIGLPGGINPFTGNSQNADIAKANIERAENLQTKAKAQPNKTNLQSELISARIAAGNSLLDPDNPTVPTADATEQYGLAATAWDQYVKATNGNPDTGVAQQLAPVMQSIAGGSLAEFRANMATAVEAQTYVTDEQVKQFESKKSTINPAASLTTLAQYQYVSQDFKAADATGKKALALATDPALKKQVQTQLDADKKQAKKIGTQIKAINKQASKDKGKGIEDPFGSLGSTGSSGATAP